MDDFYTRKKWKFPTRKFLRLMFRLALVFLIPASCVQSVTWLGQIGIKTTERPRIRPAYDYDFDEYTNIQRSSTRETPSDDVAEADNDVPYPDYNRHYINGEYR